MRVVVALLLYSSMFLITFFLVLAGPCQWGILMCSDVSAVELMSADFWAALYCFVVVVSLF